MNIQVADIARTFGRQTRAYAEYRIFSSLARFSDVVREAAVSLADRSVLIERYRGSRDVLLRRLPHRRDGLINVRGIGRMTWRDVAGLVQDCADSDSLTDLERFAANRTGRWLDSLGIHPTD